MLNKSHLKRSKKKTGLKSLLLYFIVIVFLSVLAYGYKMFNAHLQESFSKFELEDIHISGNHILADEQVLKILGLESGSKLLEISALTVIEKLKKSPYVRAVNAVYSLPSTLRINIQERKPIAFLYGRGLNMIDEESFILPVPETNISWNLPVITGIKEKLGLQGAVTISPQVKLAVKITRYLNVVDMPLREMVSEISFANKNYIEMGLTGSSTIIKVDYENYPEQLFIASRYIKDYVDFDQMDKLEYVDVRFNGQIIIKEIKV